VRIRHFESLAEIEHRITTGGPKARRTTHGREQMRSHLEVRFALHLDSIGEKWVYEPRPFGPRGRGYLPDFQIIGVARPTFIEVKPTIAEAEAAKDKVAVIWETHPEALILIAAAEGSTWFGSTGGPWATWTERWAA
jgi:hypothetical protein